MAPKKNTKMSLGTFLQDESLGSWADEMEDMPIPDPSARTSYGAERRNFSSNAGMGGGNFERRDTYPQREQLPLPDKPPYTAHLANLSFDATQADVGDFFRDCEVTNIRIVEDKLDRKPKGFGYVEFASLDGLKAALALTNSNLAGRSVRISVADPPKERLDSRDLSDWSRKGPLPDLPNQRRVSDRPGYNRSFDNMSDAGSERGSRRGFGGENDGRVRDFSNWERKGPLSPSGPQANLSLRDSGRQPSKDASFRKNSPSWGEGTGRGSDTGSRPPRKEYQERPIPERQPTAADMDNQWRARMKPDAPAGQPESPEVSAPTSPAPAAAPATRPRLNLQKRTVSEAVPEAASGAADSKASPFGAARPVDTAAKEREVEEKRQIALREKREAEEKAKAAKAEEKKQAKEKADAERKEKPTKGEDEEDEEKQKGPKFDILRRAESGTNDMIADEDRDDANGPGQTENMPANTKENVKDAGNKTNGGSWRRGAEVPAEAATETVEEDGWSTVPKSGKQRKGRTITGTRGAAS